MRVTAEYGTLAWDGLPAWRRARSVRTPVDGSVEVFLARGEEEHTAMRQGVWMVEGCE